ncbi:uncharacterized protein LOC114396621 [Glycine soja]|uniref:DUF3741 domain-containing protein n=1 Tax=Glycine soja TaxID=3848 RepID=A0A445LSH4_GLYSO|nr:uncharacterized protein LOC114396621 [Glycine soja]RZC26279.1 hypothetical protein D0Y65_004781 [Glycine soja]
MKKILTSSSSSYSSTLSLDSSLCNSKSATTAGCLTAILRRILCSGGLPTHPSDQIGELDSMPKMSDKVQEFKTKHNTESIATATTTTITPGILERLMGLESMVVERDTNTANESTSSSSLPRSKSMNSVDYLGECKRMDGLHKRAKSSSFREVPTFLLHESENFLVLSFESGCDGGEFRSKERKKEKGSKERSELKKNKREKVHDDMFSVNVGNDGEFAQTTTLFMACSEKEYVGSEMVGFSFSHPVKRKEVTNGEKLKRRKKGTTCYAEKKVDTECSSEDSSPVSIFDFERGAPETEMDTSWRRKLSPELENEQLDDLHCDSNLMIKERKVNTIEDNKNEGSKKSEKQSQECIDIRGEICMLVEGELGSNRLEEGLWKQGDIESVCADFESQIFYHMLHEFIDQLVGDPLKALQFQNL